MGYKSAVFIIVAFFIVIVLSYSLGTKKTKKVVVDLSVEKIEEIEREPKYKMMPAALSNYICDMAAELKLDPDLVVAILMVENPSFNPDAISRPNENGTLDLGMFQLNDKYLWTTFREDYWFDNVELDPFNWKHNTYIALHLMADLHKEFKVPDDAIMAYNGGRGAVMNGNIKPGTVVYLREVKNNYMLLKNCEKESL
jgi:hypothetical protein